MTLHRYRWLAAALFVSNGSMVLFMHGLSAGGSLPTAGILVLSTAALFAVGDWAGIEQDFCDLLFIAFAGYVALSIVMHPSPELKELALLSISLLCYPAGRLFPAAPLDAIFPKIMLTVATVGAFSIVQAILTGSVTGLGKPMVFGGLAEGPPIFMIPLVIAVGALLASDKIQFGWLLFGWVASLAVVFAAAMVRFTFAAALAAGIILALSSSRTTRRFVLAGAAGLLVAMAIGQVARPSAALLYKNFAAQSLGVGESSLPAGKPAVPVAVDICPPIDENNSIEVRKSLYRDWLRLIVDSDLTGIGLDGFMQRSCHPNTEIHNDLLQVALEFGWPAAGLLALLIVTCAIRLVQDRERESARFGLFVLSFLVLMSMAHGRVSRDLPLFFFIGYAVQFGTALRDRLDIAQR